VSPESALSLFPIWGWLDLLSTFVVLLGVCGEVDWVVKKMVPIPVESRRIKFKKTSEKVLIIGIAGEMLCLPFSLYDSANLNLKASDAIKEAKQFQDEAAQLTQQNLELKKTMEPRFEKFDAAMFKKLIGISKSKIEVELLYQEGDVDSYELEKLMKDGLVANGWTTLGPRPITEADAIVGSDKDAPMSVRAGIEPQSAPPNGDLQNFITLAVVKKKWPPLGQDGPSEYPVDWVLGAFNGGMGMPSMSSFARISNESMPDGIVRFIIAPKSKRW
jgi:hypothetical protein